MRVLSIAIGFLSPFPMVVYTVTFTAPAYLINCSNASELSCLYHSRSFPEVHRSAFRTLAFLKVLPATTTPTRLLSALSRGLMGPGARWGSISNLAPSQPRRDQAGWVLPSDWRSR